jgi:hypothetical protein
MVGETTHQSVALVLFQQLERVFADRFEHPIAAPAVAKETLFDERGEGVEVGVADLDRCVERTASCEDSKPCEEPLLISREKLVAPFDRRPQRALALGHIPRAARQKRKARLDQREQLVDGEHLRSSGGEFNRER